MKYSWRLSGQAWFGLLALGLVLWLTISYASLIMEIIWIILGAFLLSLATTPLADFLGRWRIPRSLTVLAIYIGLIGLLVIVGLVLAPVVSAETSLLRTNGPTLLQTAITRLSTTPFLGRLIPSGDALSQNLVQYLTTLGPALLNTVAGIGGVFVDLAVAIILAFFLASDTTLTQRVVQTLVPASYHSRVLLVIGQLRERLTRWIWSQMAIAFYLALTFGIGLALLGVPFALTIALVGGILEIIPYVGGVVAVVLAALSALTVAPQLALWVILLYVVVAEIQSHVVIPALYGRAMHLHPAAVLLALLIGAKIKGLVGVFFAMPLVMVFLTLIQEMQTVSSIKNPKLMGKNNNSTGVNQSEKSLASAQSADQLTTNP